MQEEEIIETENGEPEEQTKEQTLAADTGTGGEAGEASSGEAEEDGEGGSEPHALPTLPLRGITVFPGMLISFDVERAVSVAALNAALAGQQKVLLVSQRDISVDMPEEDDLYSFGTLCTVKQVLRIPGSNFVKIMVEGVSRAQLQGITSYMPYYIANYVEIPEKPVKNINTRTELLIRRCVGMFDSYASMSGAVTPETVMAVVNNENPGYLADFVTQNIYLRNTEKQQVLEELRPVRRLELICRYLERELNILEMEKSLDDATREEVGRSQRDYFLREQLRVIQRELGEGAEDTPEELEEYQQKITALHLPEESEKKLLKELGHLSKQPFGSSEGAVLRSYLDIVTDLPWNRRTKDTTDIRRAAKILDEDHFGLEKVKERIIEYLAVRHLAPNMKGAVLCLVGPPGVGKTSIAMSIARATRRKLCRISLGGVHDEAEIRGHRKTYVGAMPGRIVAGLQQAGSMNPVMVLDEIDKLGSDYRGDPSAALLEALDGEQNSAFRDHFIEIPMDLSEVFFITTANTTDSIPRALLDRMEVIRLDSYTDEEKLEIAKRYLLPKQRKKHGLTAAKLKLTDGAIRELISDYTRESGVRVLERQIAAVCRKTAAAVASGEKKGKSLRSGDLEPLLGPSKYKRDRLSPSDEVGLVHGLAWTQAGGEMLDVEVNVMDGSGSLELTGNLGDVMKESARAALSYIRTRCVTLGVDPEFYKNKDIHIHFPEGAVPKDGPSAGITICIALISALTGIPVRRDIAMTGEISLRGRILPIGGLKEKTMAALRMGIHTVIIPADNEPDLAEIDQRVRSSLNFIAANHVDKILSTALCGSFGEAVREQEAQERQAPEPKSQPVRKPEPMQDRVPRPSPC